MMVVVVVVVVRSRGYLLWLVGVRDNSQSVREWIWAI